MVNSMVVVPQHTAGLGVGVVIVLELSRLCDIFGPAIPGGALRCVSVDSRPGEHGKTHRVRAVQMHRVGHGRVVDEPHHGLAASLDQECRAGRDAIVSHKVGGGLVGIHLLLKVVDVDLVVVNGLICDRVGDGP